MNNIVLLILNYLPPVASLGGLVVVGKVFLKKLSDKVKVPDKLLEEIKEVKSVNYKLNKQNEELLSKLDKVIEENEELKLRAKGIMPNDK